ncbi:DUF6906 family protein [Coprococcus hominis (ex Arizal et al. 2022)]|uniref:DUF6906 family protein n=1 Tax=Coprococcus hominis (ex Arizal et al. 2022) TaxID=2881262 RepID=UPI003B50BC1C
MRLKDEKLKRPAKPTRKQKEIMAKNGLRWENWNVVADCADHIIVESKASDRRRVAYK